MPARGRELPQITLRRAGRRWKVRCAACGPVGLLHARKPDAVRAAAAHLVSHVPNEVLLQLPPEMRARMWRLGRRRRP
jgi:hypothetical protein